MRTIATLLLKILVNRFYIINAGFLLFIFFVFFGMVNGSQLISYHRSLILATISSPVVMGVVWTAWLLYNLKCIFFCNAIIKAADSTYLHTLKTVSPAKQVFIYLLVSVLQYMPVLLYSFFIVYMAVRKAMLFTASLVVVYQLLMVTLSATIIFITINKRTNAPFIEKIIAAMSVWNRIKMGYYSFFCRSILYEKKMAFTVVKIFSVLLLSVSFVRNGDVFDNDLFGIFFQLIMVAHAVLVFYCVNFAEIKMQFSRNLPLALHKIAGTYIFTYAVILLPEMTFMLINNHGNLPVSQIVLLYCTAFATLFLYTAILYSCALDMENYMLFVFIVFVVVFFLQKTGLQFLTMLAILLTAGIIFKTNYYLFEKE